VHVIVVVTYVPARQFVKAVAAAKAPVNGTEADNVAVATQAAADVVPTILPPVAIVAVEIHQ